MIEGVSLFMERAKSFIQFWESVIFVYNVCSTAVSVWAVGIKFSFFNHANSSDNLKNRNGKKGTAKSPSSRNYKLYCIRLDKMFFRIRFISRKMPMMLQSSMLQIKKRIIKSAIVFSPFSISAKEEHEAYSILIAIIYHF